MLYPNSALVIAPTAEGACRAGTRLCVCGVAPRTLLRTPLSLRGAHALPLSASAWPTRPSRSRGHTPQSRARMRPRSLNARAGARGPARGRQPARSGATDAAARAMGLRGRGCGGGRGGCKREGRARVRVSEGEGGMGGGERHLHNPSWHRTERSQYGHHQQPKRTAGGTRADARAVDERLVWTSVHARVCGRAHHLLSPSTLPALPAQHPATAPRAPIVPSVLIPPQASRDASPKGK